jgi:hypothetical protein
MTGSSSSIVNARPSHRTLMRRLLARATLLLALAAPTLLAQQKAHAVASTATELTRLENQWASGLVQRNRALFEKLLAPKFVYTENDKLMSRADVLHDVAEGSDRVSAARNEGMEVHEYGPTTAVVTGWLIVEGRGKGGPFTHRYRFTDTWVKGAQGWQIVAAQDYLAPK